MTSLGSHAVAPLKKALIALRTDIGKDVELQSLIILMIVAEAGEISFQDIQREVGIGASAVSRNIGLLGSTGYRNGGPQRDIDGIGLVEAWEDATDRRSKLVRLTPKGRLLINRACGMIGC